MAQSAKFLGWTLFVDQELDGSWKAWILDEHGKCLYGPQPDSDNPFSESATKKFIGYVAWDLKDRPKSAPEPFWLFSPR